VTRPRHRDPGRPRRRLPPSAGRRPGLPLILTLGLALTLATSACSPLYVLRAGLAQARILAARQPMSEVILDSATDREVRDKLTLVREARAFAATDLQLEVGDSYTSFVDLPSDTLALVLSAAYRDRFEPRTWWFPVVGRVPYRGFFDEDEARREQQRLEDEGFDTLLRPTSAFSTLGWFADPLMSTLLRYDHVELVETVIHELSHNHLFVPGQVRFNESWATFVGRVGAIEFFCQRPGGGFDSVWCERAQARWRDARRWSAFVDALVADLQNVYSDPALTPEHRLERREQVYEQHRARFAQEVEPTFESLRFGAFLAQPLNNAVLLGQMRYYHRLEDFERWRGEHGALASAVQALVDEIDRGSDPFAALGG
jgi:predicted aminopeptidase